MVFEGPKYVFPMVSHVLGISRFENLGNLCVGYFVIFPKVIRELLVDLSFDSHLSTYGNFCLADVVSRCSRSFVINV